MIVYAANNNAGNEEDAASGVDEGISDNDDDDEEDPLDDDGDYDSNEDANKSLQLEAVAFHNKTSRHDDWLHRDLSLSSCHEWCT